MMSKANVSELKTNLSAYLAKVRRGETVIVYDRGTPIARLEPFGQEDHLILIDETSRPAELKRIKGVRPQKPVDVDRVLNELRQDR